MTAQQDPATRPAPWPRAAVSAAIFRDGRVLIAERAKGPMSGVWSLPGGHVEAGETTRVAALRELREETAVEATLDGLVDVVDVIRHDGDGNLAVHYILTVFHGTWRAGEPVAGSDAADARFVSLDALPDYRLTDGAEAIIRRAAELDASLQR